jgi:2-methylcitrate dehydratase PrpD
MASPVTKTNSSAAEPSHTFRLAHFSSGLTFEQLPVEAVEKLKLCILDTLGCAIFGTSLASVQKLAAMVGGEGCGDAVVFGSPMRTAPSVAALINGTSAHAFQLDEIHLESTLHPGSLALPAALALADGNCTGRDLMTAVAGGYEVGIRVGLAAKGGMFKSGFHNQGTTGVFVAAAAAAQVLRLSADQMQHALGIAGSQAAGLMAVQNGAMAKSFHSGRAAQSGVYAARLAQLGYTGIPDVLDGAYGTFFPSFLDDWSESALTEGLGTQWHLMRVGFKPAPAANGNITAMTAMDKIMRAHRLAAMDIETVTAHVSANTLHHCGWPYELDRIQSVLSAQMNLRYGIAVMALERNSGAAQFSEAKIRDPNILAFIKRIEVEHDPQFDGDNGRHRIACRLVVRCKNGGQHQTTVLYRKGSPEDPMTRGELEEKFQALSKCMGRETSDRIEDIVSRLEDIENVSELSRLLILPQNNNSAALTGE